MPDTLSTEHRYSNLVTLYHESVTGVNKQKPSPGVSSEKVFFGIYTRVFCLLTPVKKSANGTLEPI